MPALFRVKRVALVALGVAEVAAGMIELHTPGIEVLQLITGALGKNYMARVTVIGLDRLFPVRSLVLSVMATEAAGPVFMSEVVWMDLPARLHFGENILVVNILDHLDHSLMAGIILVLLVNRRCDLLHRFSLRRVIRGKNLHGELLDPWNSRINLAERHGKVKRIARVLEDVGRAVVAIDTIHSAYYIFFRIRLEPRHLVFRDDMLLVSYAHP